MSVPHVSSRRGLASAAAALGLTLAGLLIGASPALAADEAELDISPSEVTAGYPVTITARCTTVTEDADVTSQAFGSVVLHESQTKELTAQVTVPSSLPQGGYDVTLTCHNGATDTKTLWVRNRTQPTYQPGPHTGGGFLALGGGGDTGARAWLAGGAVALIGAAAFGGYALRRRPVARARR
jgi:hypothetical protein